MDVKPRAMSRVCVLLCSGASLRGFSLSLVKLIIFELMSFASDLSYIIVNGARFARLLFILLDSISRDDVF